MNLTPNQLSGRIERLDAILSNRWVGSRYEAILEERNACVIEHHDMVRAHRAYDRRRAEAMEDPTGQDADAFYERYGERDSIRYNDAGEPIGYC